MGELEKARRRITQKANELAYRLAVMGASKASEVFRSAQYDGQNDVEVNVVRKPKHHTIEATGKSVLFIEFGAGATSGYGHPQANEFGFGPGTWSDGPNGKGHWDNPKGWWFTDEEGHHHSYGNPPAMAMYQAAKKIKESLPSVAREVFRA